jgi:hypothetical protein
MAIVAVAVVLILLLAVELALPRVAGRVVARRLTRDGGHARVELRAFPASKLIRSEGDSITVRASGLKAPSTAPERPANGGGLSHLDGFDTVDIQVIGIRLGPLEISRLTLIRHGDEPYRAHAEGSLAGTPIPIDVTADIESHDGRPRATKISGSVAGMPAGAIVELITAALASRI